MIYNFTTKEIKILLPFCLIGLVTILFGLVSMISSVSSRNEAKNNDEAKNNTDRLQGRLAAIETTSRKLAGVSGSPPATPDMGAGDLSGNNLANLEQTTSSLVLRLRQLDDIFDKIKIERSNELERRLRLYSHTPDEMTGKPIVYTSVKSTNTVSFGYPYAGAQYAKLLLRQHPRFGLNVILSIERGKFVTSEHGGTLLARFDNGSLLEFHGFGAADESENTLFLDDEDSAKFLAQLKQAQVVRLSATVYQNGNNVFKFRVAGLKDF